MYKEFCGGVDGSKIINSLVCYRPPCSHIWSATQSSSNFYYFTTLRLRPSASDDCGSIRKTKANPGVKVESGSVSPPLHRIRVLLNLVQI